MESKTDGWENYPLEDLPKLIFTTLKKIAKFIVSKITYYRERPGVLSSDINILFHKLKYNWLNFTDPPPPKIKNETDDEFFDRVDPKYGLRFYEVMVSMITDFDITASIAQINKNYHHKKDRKTLKDLAMLMKKMGQRNNENFKKYQIRSEILKNQS